MNKWYQVTLVALDSHPMKHDIPWPLEVKIDFYQEGIDSESDAIDEAKTYFKFSECWEVESVSVVTKQ